jgi:quercetin dioxygenase-like cupin family protein
VVNTDEVLVMQIALRPGQSVPSHKANSTIVHLLVLAGGLTVDLDGTVHTLATGDLLPVAGGTPMNISSAVENDTTFLVIKTPNPALCKL